MSRALSFKTNNLLSISNRKKWALIICHVFNIKNS